MEGCCPELFTPGRSAYAFLLGLTSTIAFLRTRIFTSLSTSMSTVSSSLECRMPSIPPEVTILSPFFISVTFCCISFCFLLCGRMMKNQKMKKINPKKKKEANGLPPSGSAMRRIISIVELVKVQFLGSSRLIRTGFECFSRWSCRLYEVILFQPANSFQR